MEQYGETVYLNISSFTGLPSRAGAAPVLCVAAVGRAREELINTPHSI